MKAASCFSGIGAPELGGPQFDWVWCAEVEKFPSAVLAARFPHSVNLGDVTAEDFLQRASAFGRLDLLVGGPPCQDFSVAGLRAGVAGDRGNLSLRFMEIAHAIRPRNLLVENVPGWLNMPDNAFGCFLGALVGADDALRSPLDGKWPSAGMVAGPRARAAWRVFDAQYFGVAQRRRRVFVVADFGEGADPAAVLFERKGMSGNTPPRRETGQGTAGDAQAGSGSRSHWDGDYPHPTLNQSTGSSGGVGASNQEIFSQRGAYLVPDSAFGGGNTSGPIDIATAQTAHGQRLDFDTETFIAHSLRGEGFDASEDGTGRGTPIVPVAFDTTQITSKSNYSQPKEGDPCHPLAAGAHPPAIAFSSKDYGNDAPDDLSPTLRSMGHDKSHANGGGQMAIAFAHQGGGTQTTLGYDPDSDTAMTLQANQTPAIATAWQVRRLTPTECHRLQGFPDDHCAIERRGKIAADGPQYKALGNSWAVPNGAWIIGRIAERLAA